MEHVGVSGWGGAGLEGQLRHAIHIAFLVANRSSEPVVSCEWRLPETFP